MHLDGMHAAHQSLTTCCPSIPHCMLQAGVPCSFESLEDELLKGQKLQVRAGAGSQDGEWGGGRRYVRVINKNTRAEAAGIMGALCRDQAMLQQGGRLCASCAIIMMMPG